MNLSKMAALALVMAPALFACSAKKEPTTAASAAAAPVAVQTQVSEPQKKAVAKASESNQGGGITFSEDIKKLCPGVKAPKFGFDSADLRGEWLDALGTLATCMKSGNLAGKSLVLTGHTDPRGTDEYNMALGSERAESVKEALESLGVQDSRMSTTSRGETDARGSDEASWVLDRRVDIGLGS